MATAHTAGFGSALLPCHKGYSGWMGQSRLADLADESMHLKRLMSVRDELSCVNNNMGAVTMPDMGLGVGPH